MSNKSQNPANDFFQIFMESAVKTLSQNLDKDTYKKIEFITDSSSKITDIESLKNGKVIYKLEFARGGEPSSLAILIPEDLLSNIADVMMGGSGDEVKDQLTELDINATMDLFKKVFHGAESAFKKAYDQDLAFSSQPSFLLKEMPDYILKSESTTLDLLVSNTLLINEEKEYKIDFLFNNAYIQGILSDLGFLKSNPKHPNSGLAFMDIEKLSDVQIEITAELGRTSVPIKYALGLVPDSIVELDTVPNSEIKVFANGVEVALAEVVAVEDNFGLKITKIISPEERLGKI